MSSWPLVALGDVFEIARGGSPRPIDEYITDEADGLNWITISDASDGSKYITGTKRRIRRDGAKRSRMVQPGDLLLTNSMSFGRPYIMRTSGCIHDGWLVLTRKAENVDSDFFFHLLGSKAVYSEFERRAAGVTVKNLNIGLVKGVHVALPPLPEQRRIAAVLDGAEALRARRHVALLKLETLAHSVFLDMFGDPATNPKRWAISTIGEVAEKVTDGEHLTPKRTSEGIKLLSARNIRDGFIDFSDVDYISRDEYERIRRRCDPSPGDVLLSCSGTIGRVACVETREPLSLVRSAALVRPKQAVVSSKYLEYYLRTPAVKALMLQRANASSQANLFQGQIREIGIFVPPLSCQNNFSLCVAAVEKLKARHRASLASLDALCVSLQHRAFRGDLWPAAPQPQYESQATS